MVLDFAFILNSILLGVGLAMDAFSVSIANGMEEPDMKAIKRVGVASTYAIFQFAMPMLGWICVHTIAKQFAIFEHFIPWIALILLLYIGGKMVIEYINDKKNENEEESKVGKKLTFWVLMLQGVATAIDALSVGFVIADYTLGFALLAALIIAIVTLGLCLIAIFFGSKMGKFLSDKANLIGGIILILIGIEIFVKGMINLYA